MKKTKCRRYRWHSPFVIFIFIFYRFYLFYENSFCIVWFLQSFIYKSYEKSQGST